MRHVAELADGTVRIDVGGVVLEQRRRGLPARPRPARRYRWATEMGALLAAERVDVDELAERARTGVVSVERPWPTTARPEGEFIDPRLVPARLGEPEPSHRAHAGGSVGLGRVDELLQATMGMSALVLMVRAMQTGILVSVFERMARVSRELVAE